jgi:hypothetical protein
MRARTVPASLALLLAAAASPAAGAAAPVAPVRPAVRYLAETKLFALETERTSYVQGVNR